MTNELSFIGVFFFLLLVMIFLYAYVFRQERELSQTEETAPPPEGEGPQSIEGKKLDREEKESGYIVLTLRNQVTGEALEEVVKDPRGKPVDAADDFGDGRRRIDIPGFQAGVFSYSLGSALEEPVAIASYHEDDKYFGLQVSSDWLAGRGVHRGDLLVFRNSRDLLPDRLTIYSTEPAGPFKAGTYRAGKAASAEEGEGVLIPLAENESPFHPSDVPTLTVYGYMAHRVATGADDSLFYAGN